MCSSLWTTVQHTQRLLDRRPSSWNSLLLTPPVCYSLWIKLSSDVSSSITESLFFNAQLTPSTSGEKARGSHQCTASLALDPQGLANCVQHEFKNEQTSSAEECHEIQLSEIESLFQTVHPEGTTVTTGE